MGLRRSCLMLAISAMTQAAPVYNKVCPPKYPICRYHGKLCVIAACQSIECDLSFAPGTDINPGHKYNVVNGYDGSHGNCTSDNTEWTASQASLPAPAPLTTVAAPNVRGRVAVTSTAATTLPPVPLSTFPPPSILPVTQAPVPTTTPALVPTTSVTPISGSSDSSMSSSGQGEGNWTKWNWFIIGCWLIVSLCCCCGVLCAMVACRPRGKSTRSMDFGDDSDDESAEEFSGSKERLVLVPVAEDAAWGSNAIRSNAAQAQRRTPPPRGAEMGPLEPGYRPPWSQRIWVYAPMRWC